MKKIFIVVFAILLLCSCGKTVNDTENSYKTISCEEFNFDIPSDWTEKAGDDVTYYYGNSGITMLMTSTTFSYEPIDSNALSSIIDGMGGENIGKIVKTNNTSFPIYQTTFIGGSSDNKYTGYAALCQAPQPSGEMLFLVFGDTSNSSEDTYKNQFNEIVQSIKLTNGTTAPTQEATATPENSPAPTQDTPSSVFKAVDGYFNVTPESFLQCMNSMISSRKHLPEMQTRELFPTGVYTFKMTDDIKGNSEYNLETKKLSHICFFIPKTSDEIGMFIEYIQLFVSLCTKTTEEAQTITKYFFKDGNLNDSYTYNGFTYFSEIGDETYFFSACCDSE